MAKRAVTVLFKLTLSLLGVVALCYAIYLVFSMYAGGYKHFSGVAAVGALFILYGIICLWD